jgi:DNA modification methylase
VTLHHSDPWLDIHGGDCREVLATLPAESVHCVVTSPPYWGLRDYGVGGQLGLEATPEEFVANMVAVFCAVRRVLRDDGTVWLNLGDTFWGGGGGNYGDSKSTRTHGDHLTNVRNRGTVSGLKPKDLVGIPWRVAFALQADGWWLRSDIIWAKPNPMPESVTDRPTKAHEYLFLLTKSPRYWYDADAVREDSQHPHLAGKSQKVSYHDATAMRNDGDSVAIRTAHRNKRSVWTVATQPYPGAHFAVMPEALVEPCILAGCPDQTCSECGAPWERVVERERVSVRPNFDGIRGTLPKSGARDRSGGDAVDRAGNVRVTTTGWKPTCAHDAPTVPGTALDPFGGSGTVARVANRLSRRAVLIDLNPEYLEQQMKRNADMPLGLTAA